MQRIAAGSIVIDTYTVRSVGRTLEALGNTYGQLQRILDNVRWSIEDRANHGKTA